MSDPSPGFVHLHNHTTYSLLDGAQKIDEMCARAAADGQSAIAVTDHGNLFGAISFGRNKPVFRVPICAKPPFENRHSTLNDESSMSVNSVAIDCQSDISYFPEERLSCLENGIRSH